MEPVINCEEEIGKTVGRRKPMPIDDTDLDSKERKREWHRKLPLRGVPKGVYRFKTHEEADEWMIKMLARTATNTHASRP